MEIRDLIKNRRKELNLTLLDIAKACDVSEATVSRWESGDIGDMKRSRISSLAKVLRISPSLIVGDLHELDDEKNSPSYNHLRFALQGKLDQLTDEELEEMNVLAEMALKRRNKQDK